MLVLKSKAFQFRENKNHFDVNGLVLSLALKQRLGATRKWPIRMTIGFVAKETCKALY